MQRAVTEERLAKSEPRFSHLCGIPETQSGEITCLLSYRSQELKRTGLYK